MEESAEGKSIVEYKAKDGQELKLSFETVTKYLVQGNGKVSKQEMMFFLAMCKSRGLNPFKKDAYLIKFGDDPAAIVTSIDYFRSRARAQTDCKGWKKGIIVQLDDGSVKDSAGLILEGEKLVGGFFEAKPEGWDYPFRLEVNLDGFIKKTRQGKITRFWEESKQPIMIAKVAESQGLRTLWPDEFQGMYEKDEIQPSEVEMIKVNGKHEASDLSEKIETDSQKDDVIEKEKCPWPECDTMCNPGKGMKSHITRQHDGEYPPKEPETDDDSHAEKKIVEPPANSSVSDANLKAEAEALAKQNKKNLQYIIYDARPEVVEEVYKRLEYKDPPMLSIMPFEDVQEIVDLIGVVNVELPEDIEERF